MIHVIPMNDVRAHDRSTLCWCGPKLEVGDGDDVVIHNSGDGREANETASGKGEKGKGWGVFDGDEA